MLNVVVASAQQTELLIEALGAARGERGEMAVRQVGVGRGGSRRGIETRKQLADGLHTTLGDDRAQAGDGEIELIEAPLDPEPRLASRHNVLQPDEHRLDGRRAAIESRLDPTRRRAARNQRRQAGQDGAVVGGHRRGQHRAQAVHANRQVLKADRRVRVEDEADLGDQLVVAAASLGRADRGAHLGRGVGVVEVLEQPSPEDLAADRLRRLARIAREGQGQGAVVSILAAEEPEGAGGAPPLQLDAWRTAAPLLPQPDLLDRPAQLGIVAQEPAQ